MRLDGQAAVVTGASRGIGLAIAHELAAHGCRVAMAARSHPEIDRASASVNERGAGRAIGFAIDVRDTDAVVAMVGEAEAEFGAITALVNNAGTPGPVGLDWEVDIIDPPASFGGWNTGRVVQQIFESLVEDDLEDEASPYTRLVPALADEHDISPDGLVYTFRLQKNVRFHDGTPFDAAAVIFNFERMLRQEAPQFSPFAAD